MAQNAIGQGQERGLKKIDFENEEGSQNGRSVIFGEIRRKPKIERWIRFWKKGQDWVREGGEGGQRLKMAGWSEKETERGQRKDEKGGVGGKMLKMTGWSEKETERGQRKDEKANSKKVVWEDRGWRW
jgi:hypothetical protein